MKVGSIYVDIKGRMTPLEKTLEKARQLATSGADRIQSAYDSAMGKVRQVSTTTTNQIAKGWSNVKGVWMEGVAVLASMAAAWNLMNTAAKAEQERRSFEALARSYGVGSKQIIAGLKEASGQAVDTMTLVRSAGTAMMMGINPADTVELMRIAAATAKMTGQDVSTAFEDIALAVGRQSRMILDNLGIILDVGKANEEYAASLGKTSASLTDAEKKQAFMNATFKAGRELIERLGGQTDTAADKFQRLTATVENIKVAVGDGLIRTFYFLKGTLETLSAVWLACLGVVLKFGEAITWLTDKVGLTKNAHDELKISVEAAFGAAGELAEKADQSFRDMRSSNQGIIEGQVEYQQKLRETKQLIEDQAKAQKKILDDHKKASEEKKSAEKEMYEEAGIGADKYFANEATALVKKAARWQKAGASAYDTEQWLYNKLGALSKKAWSEGESMAGAAMDSMQAQARTLVDGMLEATEASKNQLQEIGIEIETLDGSHIGITAALDGSGIISEVDTLIAKFEQLRAASSSITSGSAPSQGENTNTSNGPTKEETTDEWLDRMENAPNQNVTNVYVNEKVNRSDINSIINEQQRAGERG